jgi:hypothetical protein
MSEVNFGSGSTPVDAPASEQQNAQNDAQQTQSQAVARPVLESYTPTLAHIILPSLQLAHPVGEVGKTHPHGAIVYDNRIELYAPAEIDAAAGVIKRPATPPVIVTVLAVEQPEYTEKVAGGKRGLTVKTEEAVTACGGTLDYNEWQLKKSTGMKYFVPKTRLMLAIERPERLSDDGSLFVHEVDGKKYTLAFFTVKAGAYTAVCKRVVFPAKITGCLMRGYPAFSFALSTRLNSYDSGNSSWVPVLVPNKASSESFLKFAQQVLQG